MNTSTSDTATLTYDIKTLPAADLKVTDDGKYLYWTAIAMSDGKAVDQLNEFKLSVRKDDQSSCRARISRRMP